MAETQEFGAELSDFRKRVEELRAARALPSGDRLATLDTALIELQYASEVLWPQAERLDATRSGEQEPGSRRERQLLRALFQRLPLAVVLLDGDGVVRRLNLAAGRLFGMRAGYATGRSLAASFRQDARAAFRSHVAAVARGEGDRSIVVELLRDPAIASPDGAGHSGTLRVTLVGVRPSGQRRRAVMAVFQPAAQPPGGQPAAAPAARGTGRLPDAAEVTRHAELMDLVDDMTTVLLTGGAAADGETPLVRAARLLRGRFADWVITDSLPTAGGRPRRLQVLGPPEGPGSRHSAALADQDPQQAPLIGEVTRTGSGTLVVRPEDVGLLGDAANGAPVIALTEASSLLCVPVAPTPDSGPLGVLTLIRSGGRRPFELAEASAMDRMTRHIALAQRGA